MVEEYLDGEGLSPEEEAFVKRFEEYGDIRIFAGKRKILGI